MRFGLAESVLGLVPRASGKAIREHRRATAHRLPVVARAERWAVEPRAAAAFPLRRSDGAILAILGVWSTAEPTLDPRSIASIDTAVPYASLHLTQVLLYGEARDDSQRDPLTGLLNRRGFEQQLAEEAARSDRYGRPMAVAMLDIDRFKSINDTHGHDGGDAVLRALGEMLASVLRETDTPARLGGEEFVVLMPETPLEAAMDTAERLRARLQSLEVPWRGGLIAVTASFGVSAIPDCVPSVSALLTSADEALYASKRNGRNRVTAAVARR
jgi:diguanylate cyclase (GGDEF)-like protein